MKVDMMNATKKIAIEVNGAQHSNYNKFFHANSRINYLNSIKRDFKKLEWLEQNNYNLIEVNYDEVDSLSKDFFKKKFKIDL
jgi:very-short-patch-repair endonuclease